MTSRFIVGVAAMLATAMPVGAQSPRARLLVTVADTTGAVIPDAKVNVVASRTLERWTDWLYRGSTREWTFGDLYLGGTPLSRISGFERLLREVLSPGRQQSVVALKIQASETVNVAQTASGGATVPPRVRVKISDDNFRHVDDPDELARQ